ncbi:hypothetical protein [Ignatzschineria cameli]|uniref:Uncharacterized protein n=2 Tax=Ignatzschineria cameli TaxID=2182793 RepID=A0A2U2AST2_9GAMM|nr:hypothetical protein [Ignatzschineria cameli]PWD87798.1 hypothetical protein DC077_00495 [Ignatzschineria cameli]PWD90324.1 hypothetical protein DC079_04065 [Ignatzschineria cameli]PWD93001.1 hypothetical protein DC078_04065 [Ignatzschineria cameli]
MIIDESWVIHQQVGLPTPIAEKTESGNKERRMVVLLFVARAHKSRKVVNREYILFSLKRMSIWQKRDFLNVDQL